MPAPKSTYFTNKKIVVQFVLSLLVFFIHFSVFSVFGEDPQLTQLFGILRMATRVAVPLFFVISGALFFRDYTFYATLKKWKSRFFSLCIPYLVWNTLWLLLALLGYYTPLGNFLGGVKAAFTWENILAGIFLHRFFEPFWFIRQSILLAVLCPLIYLLLKNRWVGLVAIAAFYAACFLGLHFSTYLFYDTDMILFYLIGAYIGIHGFQSFTSQKPKWVAGAGLCVYILCCVFHGFSPLLPAWCETWRLPLLVNALSCFAFWLAFDLFDHEACPKFTRESFLLYAGHSLVGAAVSKLIRMLLPQGHLFTCLTALVAFPATVVILCICGRLLERFFPRLKRILTGK